MVHSFLHFQASSDQKVKEVTHWLLQAYDELLEGWDSTEGESYAERFHVRAAGSHQPAITSEMLT